MHIDLLCTVVNLRLARIIGHDAQLHLLQGGAGGIEDVVVRSLRQVQLEGAIVRHGSDDGGSALARLVKRHLTEHRVEGLALQAHIVAIAIIKQIIVVVDAFHGLLRHLRQNVLTVHETMCQRVVAVTLTGIEPHAGIDIQLTAITLSIVHPLVGREPAPAVVSLDV